MVKVRLAIVFVLGLVMLFLGFQQSANMNKKAIDILDPDYDISDLQSGDHVRVDAEYVLGMYGSREKDGKEQSRIYLLPHFDDKGEVDGYVGVTTFSKDFADMEKLADGDLDEFRIDGIVQKTSSDETSVLKSCITRCQGDADDFVELKIVPNNGQAKIFFVAGGLMSGISGLVLVILIANANKKKKEDSAEAMEYADANM